MYSFFKSKYSQTENCFYCSFPFKNEINNQEKSKNKLNQNFTKIHSSEVFILFSFLN